MLITFGTAHPVITLKLLPEVLAPNYVSRLNMAARNTHTHTISLYRPTCWLSAAVLVLSTAAAAALYDLSGQATYQSLLTSELTKLELSYEQLSPTSLSLLDAAHRRHYVKPLTLQSCELNSIIRPRRRAGHQRASHVTDGRCAASESTMVQHVGIESKQGLL